MKKILLSALIASAATLSVAEQKTATFDFSNPAAYGYAKAESGSGTNLAVGNKITSNGVDVTVLTSGTGNSVVRFFTASTGAVTLRMATDCSLSITAGDENIKSITLTGNNLTYGTNFSSTTTGWNDKTWTGSAKSVDIVRTSGTLQFATMTVVYGEKSDEGGKEEITETFEAVTAKGLADCFSNAVADGTKSIVSFGTEHMEAQAVGGRVPKRLAVQKGTEFTDWAEYDEPKWDLKNQNLCDKKPGVDTTFFYYVVGTGNPVVEIGHSDPKDSNTSADTVFYDPTYIYYGPYDKDTIIGDKTYTHALPKMGLYYTFKPKCDGYLMIKTWVNKGNRFTYLIDEETAMPVKYKYEGYVNGQDEKNITVTMKDVAGQDSIGTMNRKRFLTAAQIDSLHYTVKSNYMVDTTFVDATLTGEARVAAENVAKIDTTDLRPYVIGGGNQAFWGWITLQVSKGKCYWLFQDSSQIGFAGYTFSTSEPVVENPEQGIENIVAKRSDDETYDFSGKRVTRMVSGQLYIQNGKKILVR